MATVSFSVPDAVRDAFNQAFAGENKSAVIARLMKVAVEERRRAERRARAIEEILAQRNEGPAFSAADARAAREEGRP